jgi:hypothetical protein
MSATEIAERLVGNDKDLKYAHLLRLVRGAIIRKARRSAECVTIVRLDSCTDANGRIIQRLGRASPANALIPPVDFGWFQWSLWM